jgi:hypothetical protein
MHLDDGQVARLVDGELGAEAGAVRAHLAECADCRAQAEAVGAEVDWLDRRLRALDHDPPAVTAAALARRAAASRVWWGWRWAAGVALAVGLAGVAWAAPGSPLPGLVRRVTAWAVGSGRQAPRNPVETPAVGDPGGEAGIAVVPGPDLVIVFGPSPSDGSVEVSLFEGAEVEVRGPAGAATFTAEESRVVVDRTAMAAAFEVRIPRSAPRVEIRAGTTPLFLKVGDRITAATPPVAGRYALALR